MVSDDGSRRMPCETGWVTVPENRRDDASRDLELAFLRFRSPRPDPGPPIILLEGGPGGSGIETCSYLPERYLAFLEFGDVIALDQRGVGLSRPNLTSPYALDLPLDRAVSREEFLAEAVAEVAKTMEFWRSR